MENQPQMNSSFKASYEPADLVPFSICNFSEKGEISMNVLIVGPKGKPVPHVLRSLKTFANEDVSRKGDFKIFTEDSLISIDCPLRVVEDLPNIHFVYIFIDVSDPEGLKVAADEVRYLDPLFIARQRIGFWLMKENFISTSKGSKSSLTGHDVDQINSDQLLAFMKSMGTHVRTLFTDSSESVERNTRLMYNKVKRLLLNPHMS